WNSVTPLYGANTASLNIRASLFSRNWLCKSAGTEPKKSGSDFSTSTRREISTTINMMLCERQNAYRRWSKATSSSVLYLSIDVGIVNSVSLHCSEERSRARFAASQTVFRANE